MCVSPLILKNKQVKYGRNKYTVPVPCGKCPECGKAKLNAWLFRLEQELKLSSNPLFVTLTYNDDNLVYTKSGKQTIDKRHVQLFMKKLRNEYKKISDKPIKYYFVGEYGTESGRPHYHAIMLNMDKNILIKNCWEKGFVKIGNVSTDSIRYVLKYCMKPRTRTDKSDDRLPEFSLMSKRMGKNYLSDAIVNYHTSDLENCFITLKGVLKWLSRSITRIFSTPNQKDKL